MSGEAAMIIRRATPTDAQALGRLAAVDSEQPLGGDALVALVDGELRAALSLLDGRAIADPFRHTAELVDLLRVRAAQLAGPAVPRRSLRARLLPARGATADA